MTQPGPIELSELKGRQAIWTALTGNFDRWGGRLPLLQRMMRAYGGDPALYLTATSANTAAVTALPDHPYAETAHFYVSDNSLFYRTDAGNPVANADFFVPQGSVIELTGLPTIKGFRFISAGGTPCNLYGSFYD